MNRTDINCCFPIPDLVNVKRKMLNWVNRYSIFCLLDNHQYQIEPHTFECILAVGAKRSLSMPVGSALPSLQSFINEKPSWLFGHLGYDLKNEIERLDSTHPDHTGFPDLFFFEPQILIRLNEREMTIETEGDADKIFREIMGTDLNDHTSNRHKIAMKPRIEKKDYLQTIEKIRSHILRGDCYELNFCQEFYAENAGIDPVEIFLNLGFISPNPFAALYRVNDRYLICASPERYLRKQNDLLISQPIKGTSSRYPGDIARDERSRKELYLSEKDRSENVMVVDLVRNDLSKVCVEGSVKVDELYGIYSFPQVHQMVSTVSGRLKPGVPFSEIIRSSFPMGSMTGAPKKKVMQLIEQYEKTKRGLFSGALGYLDPAGNFDFNVVIRSILYNKKNNYLSYQVGSGITFYSDAEKEYEECLMKGKAMEKSLLIAEN